MGPARFHLRCPHCGFEFWRKLKLKGSTSCRHCHKHFTRRDAVTEQSRSELARVVGYEQILARNATAMGPGQPDAIRGEQVPISLAEARFKAAAQQHAWLAHRPSWPDFIVETPTGPMAVEVKSAFDQLTPAQIKTFDLLERMGVRVYLWRDAPKTRACLQRWGRSTSAAADENLNLSLPGFAPDITSSICTQGTAAVRHVMRK